MPQLPEGPGEDEPPQMRIGDADGCWLFTLPPTFDKPRWPLPGTVSPCADDSPSQAFVGRRR
jgi:hypothetical protein